MKCIKLLGLFTVAAAALMAFTGTASATSLTSPAGTTYTSAFTAVSEGHLTLHGSFTSTTCANSHLAGKVEQHGANVTAAGKLNTFVLAECGEAPITVKKAGSLEFHGTTATGNGAVTWTGAEIETHTSVGLCIFTTNNTNIGTLTGSNVTKGHATLDLNSAKIPRTGGNFLCGSSAIWTGSYTFTVPAFLEVH